MKHLLFAAPLFLASLAVAEEKEPPKEEKNPVVAIVTSKGEIDVELWPKAAPKTVANFLALAEGTKEWKDPSTGSMVKKPLYDGLIFHRVIKDFMAQGGDPQGDGSGDAGFQFEDEINGKGLGLDKEKVVKPGDKPHEWLGVQSQEDFQMKVVMPLLKLMDIKSQEDLDKRKDEVDKKMRSLTLRELYEAQGYKYDESLPAEKPVKGVIAMANSGPNTNSSQFFLNLVDTPWLTGRHTVFGKVVKGMDVLEKIGEVATDENGKPQEDVKIVSIRQIKEEKK